jgi:hypothetical protein
MDTDPRIFEAINDIKTEMARVATKVEERNETALVWSGDVCKKFDRQNEKIDNLTNKIDKLPCPERSEANRGMRAEMNWIRALLVAVMLGMIGLWLK